MDKLFSEFESSTKKEWLEKVAHDLKGKDLSELNWKFEGKSFSPFFHSEDLVNEVKINPIKSNISSWQICEKLKSDISPSRRNQLSLKALEGGCNSLLFESVSLISIGDFKSIFYNIRLDWISVHFEGANGSANNILQEFKNYISANNIQGDTIQGSINLLDSDFNPEDFQKWHTLFSQFKLFRLSHTSNTTSDPIADELFNIIIHCRQILIRAPKNIESQVAASICIVTEMSDHYFGNIAKLRALRYLLNDLFESKNLKNIPIEIETQINPINAQNDKNYSIIQANAQAMAAAIGGTNRMIISLPNEEKETQNETFLRRISRNISHLLQMESYFGKVSDMAAGSYFIESLTDQLIQEVSRRLETKNQNRTK